MAVPPLDGQRFARLAPGAVRLRSYERRWLRADAFGGLTVGAMLIPQSMAYAELAGMPPQYGFYAALPALVVYALVGTSRHLGVGPEPGTAILAATGVAVIAGGDLERYIALMAALALLVGGLCLVAAALRLGFVASALSKPVLVGYISGVGLALVSSQLGSFTGVDVESDRLLPRVLELGRELGDVDGETLALGVVTLGAILVLKMRAPQAPAALAGVATATAIVAVLGLDERGVALVGAIPRGLPTPALPDVAAGDVVRLLSVAAGIALVGFTDNLLTARSVAARRREAIDADQELLALGLTNLASGLSQGFPVSSSASRTAVPAALGTHTQLVSIVAAGFVVASLTFLGPVLADVPRTALAAVVIAAGVAIVDVAGYRSLWRVSPGEAVLAGLAALSVVLFDVLVGVVVAVVLSVLVALYRIARPHDAVLGDAPGLDGWVDTDAYPEAVTERGLLVYRFDAPLFFVNAERFRQRVERALEDNAGAEEWLVLDFEGIGALDATALDTLEGLISRLDGVDTIAVARANDRVLALLDRGGLLQPHGRLVSFPTINGAVRAYRERAG